MSQIDYVQLERIGANLSCLGDRFGVLVNAIRETSGIGGEIWECGAFKGGTAILTKCVTRETGRKIRIFDTFAGLPYSDESDTHPVGAMASDYDEVKSLFDDIPDCFIYRGIMPETFAGLEDSVISVAHIDVDQYRCVKEVLEWVYPRVHTGGYIVIDDYNCHSCPGAKKAVDEFLIGKTEVLRADGGTNPQAHFIKT